MSTDISEFTTIQILEGLENVTTENLLKIILTLEVSCQVSLAGHSQTPRSDMYLPIKSNFQKFCRPHTNKGYFITNKLNFDIFCFLTRPS